MLLWPRDVLVDLSERRRSRESALNFADRENVKGELHVNADGAAY